MTHAIGDPSGQLHGQPTYQPQPYPPAPNGSYGYGAPSYGAPSYGYPVVSEAPRPVAGLGLATQILLGAAAVSGLLNLAALLGRRSLLERITANPLSYNHAEAVRSDGFVTTTAGLDLLLLIGTGIVFIVWLHRARKNVDAWQPQFQRHSPGWAIGGWFVPIAGMVIPYRVVSDVLLDSDRPHNAWRRTNPLVLTWWLLWIGSDVLALITRGSTGTVDALLRRTTLESVNEVVTIAAAVLAVFVVRQLTAAQTRKLQATQPAPYRAWA